MMTKRPDRMTYRVPPALPLKDAPTPPPPPARYRPDGITSAERLLIEAAVALFYSCGDHGLPTPMENLSAAVEHYIESITTDRPSGHAQNCDGWHHPVTGHCGDCGCFTCSGER